MYIFMGGFYYTRSTLPQVIVCIPSSFFSFCGSRQLRFCVVETFSDVFRRLERRSRQKGRDHNGVRAEKRTKSELMIIPLLYFLIAELMLLCPFLECEVD